MMSGVQDQIRRIKQETDFNFQSLHTAKPGPNTAGGQFYVNLKDNLRLDDACFTAFAKVVKGMDVVDKIGKLKNSGQPDNRALEKVAMNKVYVKKQKK